MGNLHKSISVKVFILNFPFQNNFTKILRAKKLELAQLQRFAD